MTISDFAIIDCETTGIGADHEVIELGLIVCRHDSATSETVITSRYCGRREPQKRISPRAKALHGLSKKDLKGLTLDHVAIRQIIEAVPMFIAHNASFDRDYVGRIFPELHRKTWRCSLNDIDWYSRGFQRRTLIDLAAGHGVPTPTSHRADADCDTLFALLQKADKGTGNPYLTTLLSGGEARRPIPRPQYNVPRWHTDDRPIDTRKPSSSAIWWIIAAIIVVWIVLF